MTDKEVMQMALDALENFCEHGAILKPLEVRELLRTALAQPDKEVMQMALDVLESLQAWPETPENFNRVQAIEALRAALAQPEPDYEAEFIKDWNEGKVRRVSDGKRMVPQREWQGLTDEEIMSLLPGAVRLPPGWADTVRAIEAKLKEKNGY